MANVYAHHFVDYKYSRSHCASNIYPRLSSYPCFQYFLCKAILQRKKLSMYWINSSDEKYGILCDFILLFNVACDNSACALSKSVLSCQVFRKGATSIVKFICLQAYNIFRYGRLFSVRWRLPASAHGKHRRFEIKTSTGLPRFVQESATMHLYFAKYWRFFHLFLSQYIAYVRLSCVVHNTAAS